MFMKILVIGLFLIAGLLLLLTATWFYELPILPLKKIVGALKTHEITLMALFNLFVIVIMLITIFISMVSSQQQIEKMQDQIKSDKKNTDSYITTTKDATDKQIKAIKDATNSHIERLAEEQKRRRKELLSALISEIQSNIEEGDYFLKHLPLTEDGIIFYNDLPLDILNINLSNNTITSKVLFDKIREYKKVIVTANNMILRGRESDVDRYNKTQELVGKWEGAKKDRDYKFDDSSIKEIDSILSKLPEKIQTRRCELFLITFNLIGNKYNFVDLKLKLINYMNDL